MAGQRKLAAIGATLQTNIGAIEKDDEQITGLSEMQQL